ncbi:DNA methyltransferase [Sphaerisporangium sp. NPDC004334]
MTSPEPLALDLGTPLSRHAEDAAARADLAARMDSTTGAGRPAGTDEDLLAMSTPPWHTACPNPYIEKWLAKAASTAPDREPRTLPGPFLADVTGRKTSLQYKAHAYPTKVPPEIIVQLLLHYTEPGDVVLDGFAGSGMTGVAAQMCADPDLELRGEVERQAKEHGGKVTWGARRAVLNDLAPGATFLAAGLTLPVDAAAFDQASAALLDRFDQEYGWMYATKTESGRSALIDYTIWSEVFTCFSCGGPIVFYDVAFDASTGDVAEEFECPDCGVKTRKGKRQEKPNAATQAKKTSGKNSPAMLRRKVPVRLLTGEVIERIEIRPVQIHYRYREAGVWATGTKKPDSDDLAVLDRISRMPVGGIPMDPLPIAEMVHGSRLAPKGFTHVHHLYPDRSLAALSILWAWAKEELDPDISRALRFWIEQAFWGLSWMNRYKGFSFGKIGGSQVNQHMTGVYYIPSQIAECSVRYNLEGSDPKRGKRANLVKLWSTAKRPTDSVMITTGDAGRLHVLPDDSIDYVFVDPPFGANIPYADLAQVVESWHRVLTDVEDEAIVDMKRHKQIDTYGELMAGAFREFARVLKPGRWMTVEFSNSSNEIWSVVQQALTDAGFVIADTRVLDKNHSSYRQATAVNAVKRDLMISCYKPDTKMAGIVLSTSGAAEGVEAFLREHLKHLPVTDGRRGKALPIRARFSDRLYDRMVGYYVAAGVDVPMSASEFYSWVEQTMVIRDEMVFLPMQAAQYDRFRLTFKELEAATLFITDEASAITWLRQQLRRKPQRVSEIHPAFVRELETGETPNAVPELRDLLEQNFISDASGRWMVPNPSDAVHLEQLRTRELLKVFETYVNGAGPLDRFRGEAILAGFKKAWGDGDYGRIVKVGKRLPAHSLPDLTASFHYYRNALKRLE